MYLTQSHSPWKPRGMGPTETVVLFHHRQEIPTTESDEPTVRVVVRTAPLFLRLMDCVFQGSFVTATRVLNEIKESEEPLTWDERQMVVLEAGKRNPLDKPFLTWVLNHMLNDPNDWDTICVYDSDNSPKTLAETLVGIDALVPPITNHGWDRTGLVTNHMIRLVLEQGPTQCQSLIERGWCVPPRERIYNEYIMLKLKVEQKNHVSGPLHLSDGVPTSNWNLESNEPEPTHMIRNTWVFMLHKTWGEALQVTTPLIADVISIVVNYLATRTDTQWTDEHVEQFDCIHCNDAPLKVMAQEFVESRTFFAHFGYMNIDTMSNPPNNAWGVFQERMAGHGRDEYDDMPELIATDSSCSGHEHRSQVCLRATPSATLSVAGSGDIKGRAARTCELDKTVVGSGDIMVSKS